MQRLMATLVIAMGTSTAGSQGATPQSAETPAAAPGWTTGTDEESGAVVLSRDAQEVLDDPRARPRPKQVRPTLHLSCGEALSVSIETRMAMPFRRFDYVEQLLVRLDQQPTREIGATLTSDTLTLSGVGRDLVKDMLGARTLLLRFTSWAGIQETSFALGGLREALESVASSCDLSDDFFAGVETASGPAAAPEAAADAEPDTTRAGQWVVRSEVSRFGDTSTVIMALPSDVALSAPGTPGAANLLVRALESRLEVFVAVPALLDAQRPVSIGFDDEPAQPFPASASSDRRALFFGNPRELLKRLLHHDSMTLTLSLVGISAPHNVVFDLRGAREAVPPLLEAALLPAGFVDEPPTPGKWVLRRESPPSGGTLVLLSLEAETAAEGKDPIALILRCRDGEMDAYLATSSYFNSGPVQLSFDGGKPRRQRMATASGLLPKATFFDSGKDLLERLPEHESLVVTLAGKSAEQVRFDIRHFEASAGPLLEACPAK